MNEFYPYPDKKQTLYLYTMQAVKTIQLINQVIPLLIELRPLINNLNQSLSVLKVMKQVEPVEKKEEKVFENML